MACHDLRYSRLVRLLVSLFAMVMVPACARSAGDSGILIGGVLPLTGDAGTFGVNASRGATLAVEQANMSKMVSSPIAFSAEDSRGTADGAVGVARKLLDLSKARFLLGDVTSAGTQAMIPIVTDRKTILVSPAASAPALSNSSPYFFRTWPSDVYEAGVIAAYAERKAYRHIAIIYANTDYGVAMVDQFKKSIGAIAAQPVIGADRETLDYRATLQRIRATKPDALFIVLYPQDAGRLLRQAAELGIAVPILATATFEDPKLLNAPGASRVVYASPVPPDSAHGARAKFLADYKARFHVDAGVLSDTGYDSAMLLIKAYAKAGDRGPEAMMAYVKSLRDYSGVSGTMTFDSAGDVRKPYRLRTVKNGAFAWL